MTFEEVWCIVQETSLQMKETDRKIAELAKNGEETDRKIAELAKNGEETDRKIAEVSEQQKETSKQLKEISRIVADHSKQIADQSKQIADQSKQIADQSKQIGGIDDNTGRHAEQFFQNVFAENKVFGGIEYDEIILNMAHKERDGERVEFDIVLENGKAVALIEVKNRIRSHFVQKLAEKRVKKFREYFPRYKDYDVYLGIAGFSLDKAVLEMARKYGVGIIRQVGKGIEMKEGRLKKY